MEPASQVVLTQGVSTLWAPEWRHLLSPGWGGWKLQGLNLRADKGFAGKPMARTTDQLLGAEWPRGLPPSPGHSQRPWAAVKETFTRGRWPPWCPPQWLRLQKSDSVTPQLLAALRLQRSYLEVLGYLRPLSWEALSDRSAQGPCARSSQTRRLSPERGRGLARRPWSQG